MAKNSVTALFAILLFAVPLFPQNSQEPRDSPADPPEYPVIAKLSAGDPVFAEYSRQVEGAYKEVKKPAKRRQPGFTPDFFTYTAEPKDTVFTVAARCSVPYETLVTLNGIRSADENLAGRTLILSTAPGIFVPKTPDNPVETLVFRDNPAAWPGENAEADTVQGNTPRPVTPNYARVTLGGRDFAWSGTARFSPEARIFFLDPAFALPLADFRFTSPYGNRPDPLSGVGNWQFHRGVDLAAPTGTPVKATKSGVVSEVGFNTIYGNYVIIRHTNNIQSLYGHLSRTSVTKDQAVTQGQNIGEVGSTGQSTGPHLHFEIRSGDTPQNPANLVKGIF